jgi:hypothetical protein
MSSLFSTLLMSYLLMPILAVLMGVVAYFLAKKKSLLGNRKFILYVLLGSVLLSVPALFGFIDHGFMPYIYLSLQVAYLILGYYNVLFTRKFLSDIKKKSSFWTIFLIQILMMFIGAALFSTVFNLCNELKYGLWASTCLLTFIFPPLFWETYNKYMSIPLEIYKVWKSSDKRDFPSFESIDHNQIFVVELEIFKSLTDTVPSKIKAKAPDNVPMGIVFDKILSDYNIKFPAYPIEADNEEKPYGWIFYVKRSFFHPRKYVDCDLSILENRIKEKYTIIARRVSESDNREIK